MQEFIESLMQEHESIERELVELETIMQSRILNYPNLIHVFKKLRNIWDHHEEKEEKVFPQLRKQRLLVSIEKMIFAHQSLRPHKDAITHAINAGNDFEIRRTLNVNGKVIIEKLREHIKNEEDELFTAVLDSYSLEDLTTIWASID
ncbi:MAG: hemerythrin domain-containing protein [archaeon]